MFPINKKEDYILFFLIVAVIIATSLLIFKNINFNSEDTIEIKNYEQTNISQPNSLEQVDISDKNKTSKEYILVQVGGAVLKPGVYKCELGDRIYQVIEKAGGASKDANLDIINLVDEIKDGSKIIIPSKSKTSNTNPAIVAKDYPNKVNINNASVEELQNLKGVGPSTAEKIIKYRQEKGSFKTLKELTKVPGIGEKTFAKLKSQISY
ncbi:helix-hairpin-helix domain-containing protein [Orenia marismortui]|uniref:helix-hairpin-helix domain-containing protein n=1 Tax=Orenia marismortui TaxID=46469 RepID=UPI0003A9F3BB|nr:helix-hairpin-helix domain-containing protein [Orenia marismortui]